MAAAALLATGCGDTSKPGTTANTVSNVVTAPVNYLGAVVEAQKHAEKTIDQVSLNRDIEMFYAGEGRYPTNLQEMIPNYLAKIPQPPFGYKLTYDAASHTVKLERLPQPPPQ